MDVQIPPAFFGGVGAMLIAFGVMRAYHFGWRRLRDELDDDRQERGRPSAKRHLAVGIIWVVMGIYLAGSALVG